MCLKINWFVKTPWLRPSMEVARSELWAPVFIYSTNILVRLLTVNMKNYLTQKNQKTCDPILVTLLKMRPHYSQSGPENATPSSGTSPLASYEQVDLPCFSIKKIKKPRAKLKLTALFNNMRPNTEVQKQRTLKHKNTQNGSKSTNHKSQTTTFCFLRSPLRSEGEKAPILQILIDVAEKPQIQRRFWHRRSRATQNSYNLINSRVSKITVTHAVCSWRYWTLPLSRFESERTNLFTRSFCSIRF